MHYHYQISRKENTYTLNFRSMNMWYSAYIFIFVTQYVTFRRYYSNLVKPLKIDVDKLRASNDFECILWVHLLWQSHVMQVLPQ